DWLRAAKANPMETDRDLRAGAAEIRGAGVSRFVEEIRTAMQKYAAANRGAWPASVQVFAPFLENQANVPLLQRYAIFDTSSPGSNIGGTATWGVTNIDPIDPDHESRYRFTAGGTMTISAGPLAWDQKLSARYNAAAAGFRRQNPGRATTDVHELLPYFNPPLEPETVERLRTFKRQP
ncbi:MAG: hypothetical protein ABIR80_14510, partial [Opitutaceae bacterium]